MRSYQYRMHGLPVRAAPDPWPLIRCAHCFVPQTIVRHVCEPAIGDWLWLLPSNSNGIEQRIQLLRDIQELLWTSLVAVLFNGMSLRIYLCPFRTDSTGPD